MMGLVVVSHSVRLAEGLQDLIGDMQPDVPVRAAGGTSDGRIGTSVDKIYEALVDLHECEGILVFVDLGSAVLSAEMAAELLNGEQRQRVIISDAPLVEGAILGAINAGLNMDLDELARSVQEARQFPKNVAPASGKTPDQESGGGEARAS